MLRPVGIAWWTGFLAAHVAPGRVNPNETRGFAGDPGHCFGQQVDAPDGAEFIDIVTFDKLAATCGEWLTKGREVAVA